MELLNSEVGEFGFFDAATLDGLVHGDEQAFLQFFPDVKHIVVKLPFQKILDGLDHDFFINGQCVAYPPGAGGIAHLHLQAETEYADVGRVVGDRHDGTHRDEVGTTRQHIIEPVRLRKAVQFGISEDFRFGHLRDQGLITPRRQEL